MGDASEQHEEDAHSVPLPVIPLSSGPFVSCIAAAGRSHVGVYGPGDRPRVRFSGQHMRWAEQAPRQCLYCGNPNPRGGEEHALGVSLGNWFWVLPPDVVCGRCNNGVASRLDGRLQNHPFIALTRVLANIPGRKGQPPSMGASNMKMWRDESGTLHVEAPNHRAVSRDGDAVNLRASWNNKGPRQQRETARALLKIGLAILWLGHGPDETHRPKYDHVRDAIQDRGDVPVQHGFGNSNLPSHALNVITVSHDDARGFRVDLHYFGQQLWAATDGPRDSVDPSFLADAV